MPDNDTEEDGIWVAVLCAFVPFAMLGIFAFCVVIIYFVSRAGIGFE